MRVILFAFLIVRLPLIVVSQAPIITQENILDFTVDPLQNIYTLSGNSVTKYNSDGRIIQSFSYSIYGQISSIDVTDPLRILVFYRGSNTVLFLSQQMALIGDPIELDQIEDIQVQLACISNQGGFWLYDLLSQSIMYFDANRVLRFQSQNIGSLNKNTSPIFLQEKENNVYLSFEDNNTMVFDQFAGYNYKIPASIKSDLITSKNKLAFWNGKEWTVYHSLLKELSVSEFHIIGSQKTMPLGNNSWIQLKNNQIIKFKL